MQRELCERLSSVVAGVCRLGEPVTFPSGGLSSLSSALSLFASPGYFKTGSNFVDPLTVNRDNISVPQQAGVIPLMEPALPPLYADLLRRNRERNIKSTAARSSFESWPTLIFSAVLPNGFFAFI